MKLKLLIPFLAALACYGQAVRVDPIPAFTVASNVPAGANPPILALPGATVAVCADAACATPLNTYTNAGAGTGCPSATPLVPAGTASCAGTTDSRGNFGFWVTAGTNGWYRITTSGATYGPYPFSAPGGSGGGGGSSAWSAITGGTNTTASMVMGTGSSLSRSGGTIDASSWVGVAPSPPTTTNQVVLTTSTTTGVWSTIPNCPDSGAHLNYNNSTQAFSCGTSGGTVGSVAWSAVTGGTNTSAALVVGSGASLAPTGTGTITANAIASGSSFSGTLSGPNILLSGTFTVPNSYGTVQCAELNAAGQLVPAGSGACGSGGGGTSPGGSSGQIQYNNGGAFGGFTATGDVTFSQPNFTLATVNSNVGSCGDSTHVAQVTLDAKGRTTGCTAVSITSSTPADMMTTDTAQAVTATKDFQVDQRFDGNLKMYLGSGASSFGWYIGMNGGSTLGFFNAASIVRAYIVDSGSSPAGGSGATFVGPTILAASLATNTPGMVVEGAIGGTVDIFDVTSAGMGTKYLQVLASGATVISQGVLATSNIPPLSITGYSGGTAHLLDVYDHPGGTDMLYTDYLGNTTVQLGLNVVGGITTYGVSNIEAVNYDGPALSIYGHTSGTADLLDVYNQAGGTNEFSVNRNYAIVKTGYGFFVKNQTDSQSNFSVSVGATTSNVYATVNTALGTSNGSGIIMLAAYGSNPYFVMTVGTTTYSGVTGTGVCTHFVGGICVSF